MTRLTAKAENEELAAFTPKAPSQQPNAQGPAQKPGEPLAVTTRTIPPAEPAEPEAKKPSGVPGKPEDTPGKPGTGAPGQEKKLEVNPLAKSKK